jgi:hypothetical protein
MTTGVMIIEVDSNEQRESAARWFEAWLPRLSYVSKNQGCGCCVDIYEVEGDDDAIAAIPPALGGAEEKPKPRPPVEPRPHNPYAKLLGKLGKQQRKARS